MTETTAPVERNDLLLPLYASKPQRRIPGTTCVAVTMYKSGDGSVREYAILTADGTAHIGKACWQGKRKAFAAGYTMKSVPSLGDEKWANLTEFAIEVGERLGLDVATGA